ncbi:MAG: 2-oxoacid:acceptor oxidoreductase subunit alpha [Firmicutes bacterium]|nr:2-oxoacid:acceptor oxidoreductase subunit alpha [Bacillota bacterium]
MLQEFAWKVGGQQGEGIESSGDILATVLARQGYYVHGYRVFSSRIKGGHTNYRVRVSTRPIRTPNEDLQILVAFDQESIDLNATEVVPDGVIVADSHFNPKLPDGIRARLLDIPLTQIAQDNGNQLMRNVVAIGASAYVLGLKVSAFHDLIRERWGRKGEEVVRQNIKALEDGYNYAKEHLDGIHFDVVEGDGVARPVLMGNDAVALGALAAGCRFMAAYPITPASDVMEYLVKVFPKFGGVVIQAEDEIASVTSLIGAGFAGARAMTATAGPGFSLMQEAIGLAAAAEIPIVIVDVQRAGPSTGMPTKVEQSDVMAMIFGTHGDAPRIVLAPATVEDCFYDTAEAFNLADRYQCPVIVASDLMVGLSPQTLVEPLDLSKIRIDRGAIVTEEELAAVPAGTFQRYAVTESGISPRSLPGMKNGQYLATGVEHAPTGKVTENPENRVRQMDKRARKLQGLKGGGTRYFGAEQPELLFVSFGSTFGAITETMEMLEKEGVRAGFLLLKRLWPLPVEEIAPRLEAARKVLVVEQNATGQLRQLIQMKIGYHGKLESALKYNGLPFLPRELYVRSTEVMG